MRYTVQTGDTLSAIAQSHGCTLEALLDANPRCRTDPNRLAIGDVLILPGETVPAGDGQGVDGAPAGAAAAMPRVAGAGAGVPPISERAIAMIIGFEVTSRDVYVRDLQRPTWPGLESGVTIGIGYDVGQSSVADLRASWEGQLQPAIVDRLATACGVTGNSAKGLTAQLQDVVVPWEAAEFVFRHRDIPAYTRRTCDALSTPTCYHRTRSVPSCR
jgi:LysM repeat protein